MQVADAKAELEALRLVPDELVVRPSDREVAFLEGVGEHEGLPEFSYVHRSSIVRARAAPAAAAYRLSSCSSDSRDERNRARTTRPDRTGDCLGMRRRQAPEMTFW